MRKDRLEIEEISEAQGLQVRRLLEAPGPQVLLGALRPSQVRPEMSVPQVSLDPQDLWARMASTEDQDQRVLLELLGSPVPLGCLEVHQTQEPQAQEVLQVLRATQEHMALRVQWDLQESRGQKATRACL